MPGDFLREDLPEVFCVDEFGITVLIVTGNAAGDVVSGLFMAPYSDSFGVAGSVPELIVQCVDVVDVREGDRLEILDTLYRIDSIEPDGRNLTTRFTLAVVS